MKQSRAHQDGSIRLRRMVAAGLVAGTIATAACGDLPHTNPVDPETPFEVAISGPDTVYSLGRELEFTVQTSREWHGGPPAWSAGAGLATVAPGRYRIGETGGPFVTSVSVRYGEREPVIHRLVVNQVPARIPLPSLCPGFWGEQLPPGASCEAGVIPALQLQGGVSAPVTDSTGVRYWEPTSPEVTVRDSTVVRASYGTGLLYLESLRVGKTYIVRRYKQVLDSSLITVRQVPWQITLEGCGDASHPLNAGDTGQVRAVAAADKQGIRIPGEPIPPHVLRVIEPEGARISFRADGSFTVVATPAGWGTSFAWVEALDPSGRWRWAECGIPLQTH